MKHNYKPVICSLAITKAEKFIFSKSKANFILAFLFTILGFTDVFGQVANYTFSESAGTYTTITGTTANSNHTYDEAVHQQLFFYPVQILPLFLTENEVLSSLCHR